MSKYIELAKKLKILSEQGSYEGERISAENLLKNLMQKCGFSFSDIETEETENFFFTLKTEDAPLWMQVVVSVNGKIQGYGKFSEADIERLSLPGNFSIDCTKAEYVEIVAKFEYYNRLYKEESQIFYEAFVQRNRLFSNKESDMTDTKELSPAELEKAIRVMELSRSLKRGDYRKQLRA